LTLALTGLEKYLGKDFLEVLHLRNGMLNASQPTLIAWPYLAARFLLFFILAKYFVELILQIVLLTNRSSIPGVFLSNMFGSATFEKDRRHYRDLRARLAMRRSTEKK
jgi:hypothetical protein